VIEYFQKDQIIICMYIFRFSCLSFVCHMLALHPCSLPFSLKVPKADVLDMTFFLYVITEIRCLRKKCAIKQTEEVFVYVG